jgi:hypothetical protein
LLLRHSDPFFGEGPDLLSWVPDYITHAIFPGGLNYFNAAEDLSQQLHSVPDLKLLGVSGVEVGVISHVSRFALFLLNPKYIHELLSRMPQIYVSGEKRIEVFWRTLIRDCSGQQHFAPKRFCLLFRK